MSDTSYRLTGPSSAGLTWKVHKPTIRVCYSDASNSATQRANVEYSVHEWIRGLTDVAEEPLTTNVQLVSINAGSCDVRVYVGNYAPAQTQLGSVPTVYIAYSGWYGSKGVILHEFGHAFGLLDTYAGTGGSCQSGQPDSVMCRARYDTLMPDDIAGIRAMYERTRFTTGVMEVDANEGLIVQ